MVAIKERIRRLEDEARFEAWLRFKRVLSSSSVEQLQALIADPETLRSLSQPAQGNSPLAKFGVKVLRSMRNAEVQMFARCSLEELAYYRDHLHRSTDECPQGCVAKEMPTAPGSGSGRPESKERLVKEIYVRSELWKRTLQESRDRMWELCGRLESSFDSGPFLWLTQFTRTEDTHWFKKGTPPVAPFPKDEYLRALLGEMIREDVMFIAKSREMMTSWLSCGYIAWMIQWLPVQWIIQTQKEDKAINLINYCRILLKRQDPWMQERNPIMVDTKTRIRLTGGGEVIGIPSGADQFRSYHPYGVLFDEAAFLTDFGRAFMTVRPVAKKILAVSSAGPGFFADMCQMSGDDEYPELAALESEPRPEPTTSATDDASLLDSAKQLAQCSDS